MGMVGFMKYGFKMCSDTKMVIISWYLSPFCIWFKHAKFDREDSYSKVIS
jgi:hypothetical protein